MGDLRPIVLLTNPIEAGAVDHLAQHCQVVLAENTQGDTLCRLAQDASFIVVRAPLPPSLFESAHRLRAVVRHGAGLDMIPIPEASAHGVAVANVPGVNATTVAEYVLGQMLNLNRQLGLVNQTLRSQSWGAARQLSDTARDLRGRTVAVVGMGAIGQAVAHLCGVGFGMQVLGVTRRAQADTPNLRYLSLHEALPLADMLVLACPLNDDTRGMIGAQELSLLPRDAQLINVSRGPVVVEAALLQALATGHLAGAALDVFAHQPLPPDSHLLNFPQVLLSPHMAGITQESMSRMSSVAVEQILQMLRGDLPTHWVNTDAREAILRRWQSLSST